MDRQRSGDGAAFADAVVSEHWAFAGGRADAPDFDNGFPTAVEFTKIPGRERCVGHATSDCRSRNHPAEVATPNPSRHRALPESDSTQFQINRDSHGCL